MKTFQIILIAVFVAFASAFAPNDVTLKKPLVTASPTPEPRMKEIRNDKNNAAAATAAFTTALAPFASHATDCVDTVTTCTGTDLVLLSLASVGAAVLGLLGGEIIYYVHKRLTDS